MIRNVWSTSSVADSVKVVSACRCSILQPPLSICWDRGKWMVTASMLGPRFSGGWNGGGSLRQHRLPWTLSVQHFPCGKRCGVSQPCSLQSSTGPVARCSSWRGFPTLPARYIKGPAGSAVLASGVSKACPGDTKLVRGVIA